MGRLLFGSIVFFTFMSFAQAQQSKPDADKLGGFIGFAIGCGCLEHNEKTVQRYIAMLFTRYSINEIKTIKASISSEHKLLVSYDNTDKICASVCLRTEFLADLNKDIEHFKELDKASLLPGQPAVSSESYDGGWVLEIEDPTIMPSGDRVKTKIADNKFAVSFSANGWRGKISGEIDNTGRLTGYGYANKFTYRSSFEFSAKYLNGSFQMKVRRTGGSRGSGFIITLTRIE